MKLAVPDAHDGLKAAIVQVLGATWQRCRVPTLRNLPACMTFPTQHRTKPHATNTLERPNREMKRRADLVGIFPNEASIVRLVGAVLMAQNDEGALQRRQLSLEPLAGLHSPADDEPNLLVPPPAAAQPAPRSA